MLGFFQLIEFVLIADLLQSLEGFGDPQVEFFRVFLGLGGSVAVFEQPDVANLTVLLQHDHRDILLLANFVDLQASGLLVRI